MENKAKQGLLPELWHLVRTHIRDYAMFIALAVIFILFGIFTNGNFLSPRNLTNLINQTGYIAVMAVAMTLILIIRQIDLSVGYAAGFTGAIAAIPITSRMEGLRTNAGFCAPQQAGLMNGPSRWRPGTFEKRCSFMYAATARAAALSVLPSMVSVVGRNVVQPSASFASAIAAIASGVASQTSYPLAP